ncbi:MAG: D-alanyl-D-alanine carboxypeptidase/D-alanyl-D-alanine-endopeptidase [Pseudomonadota bacterium]
MVNRSSALIVAGSLFQLLAACSSAPAPSSDQASLSPDQAFLPNGEPIAPQSFAPSTDRTIEPVAALASEDASGILADSSPVSVVSNKRRTDERFLRPVLTLDDDAGLTLPDGLPIGAEVGYVVVDLDRGTTIAQRHADRDHIPASSAKLATAVMAIELLGADHRFRTELRTTGPIEDGVLKGDLILKGGGDPVLDIPDLMPLIDALVSQPLRRIEGRFLIDDTTLPRFTEIELTQPTEAAYNPGVGALSLAFNRVNLRWQNRKGLTAETVPHLDEASFEKAVKDRLPPGGVQLKQLKGGEAVWQLADRGARRAKRSLPVKDAGLHAGQVFADLARLYGIDLPPPERSTESATSQLLAVHESRPLGQLVRDMLWYSNNLVAELIGLAAAKTVNPELTSLEMSAETILAQLKERLPDMSWEGAQLRNHSGLSSDSRLTPAQLAAVLRHGWSEGLLASMLPGSGWSGTLVRRFAGPDQAFRVWAKTGSMNYVVSLGGILLSPSHAPAAFVIMISDEKARAAYDAASRRTREGERRARAWRDDVEEVMDKIVERWLDPAIDPSSRDLYALSQSEEAATQ